MNILVTGANGFVGKNLVQNLLNVKDGKDRSRHVVIDNIYRIDRDSTEEDLDEYCRKADFVFNLAGVNRPKNDEEFMKGNFGFASSLLAGLKRHGNKCPVMLASSIQASLSGRFGSSEYGRSKLCGENLFFDYGSENDVKVLVYRFANLFGKWSKPNYNSVVATFCYNIAHDKPIQVTRRAVDLDLTYIDDLIDEMVAALLAHEHRCDFAGITPVPSNTGRYCFVPEIYHETLGTIVDLLDKFDSQPSNLTLPSIAKKSFANKLYATYLSYLPKSKIAFSPKMHTDDRGSFTELIRTNDHGQVSVNVSKPGITKGQHWHNTKWEQFIVVAGHGLIQERKIGSSEVLNFEVSDKKIEVVQMLPGYVHNIINLSETENLVTVMWANESFDPNRPDTYAENVVADEERINYDE